MGDFTRSVLGNALIVINARIVGNSEVARNRLLVNRQTVTAKSSSYRLRAAFAHDQRRMEWLVPIPKKRD